MPPFWSTQLVVAIGLNCVVQAIQIGAYAARLAGVQSGRIGTSIALFNLFVTGSRLANLLYAPMLGTISDRAAAAIRAGTAAGPITHQFEWQIRSIVLAGTVGTALGAVLLPTFVQLFLRGVAAFERSGSMPRAMARVFIPRVAISIVGTLRAPSSSLLTRFSGGSLPRSLLIGNVIVTGIYAVGVVAAVYASILDLPVARTAVLLSGIVNGVATIAFTLIVDPTSALITDQAAKGERPVGDVKAMVFFLSLTAIIGTLLSQLILYPAAEIIAGAAHLVNLMR